MVYQLTSLFPLVNFNKLYIAYKTPVTCHISGKSYLPVFSTDTMISRFVLYFYYGLQAAYLADMGQKLAPLGGRGSGGSLFGGGRPLESGFCPGSLSGSAPVFIPILQKSFGSPGWSPGKYRRNPSIRDLFTGGFSNVNLLEAIGSVMGIIFILLFLGLMVLFFATGRGRTVRNLREIPAFTRLRRSVGLAVEAGTRVHVSLGRGGLMGLPAGSALVGLTMLDRIARAASSSDRPPVATSGEGVLMVLSQDVMRTAYRSVSTEEQYDAGAGRLSGLTPFSYVAGAIPVILDEQVSTNVLVGNFGSEVGLLTEASEQKGNLTVAGTDHVPAQAVLVAAAQEPLLGEEVYAGGAYLGAGAFHIASLRAQDVLRWVLIVVILLGAFAKLVGLL